jgi:hypothetical protein
MLDAIACASTDCLTYTLSGGTEHMHERLFNVSTADCRERIHREAQTHCKRLRIRAASVPSCSRTGIPIFPGQTSALRKLIGGRKDAPEKMSPCPMCGGNQFVNMRQQVLDILDHHNPYGGPLEAKENPRMHGGEHARWPTNPQSVRSLTPDHVADSTSPLKTPMPNQGSQSRLRAQALSRNSGSHAQIAFRAGRHIWSRSEDCSSLTGVEHCGDAQTNGTQHTVKDAVDCSAPLFPRFRGSAPSSMVEGSVLLSSLPDRHLLTGHQGAILHMVQDVTGRLYTSSADKTIKVSCCGSRWLAC